MELNRFVAFIKPYINTLAAGVAAWLVAQANVLGIPGLSEENVATWIAAGLVFVATQIVTFLGDAKWLNGHHLQMVGEKEVEAAVGASRLPIDGEEDIDDDDLPPGTPDEVRVVMPTERPLEGEPDELDEVVDLRPPDERGRPDTRPLP